MPTKFDHRQILTGIAVADAVGNRLEFFRDVTRDDMTHAMNQPVLRATDDTQMTLFLYEALKLNPAIPLDGLGDVLTKAYLSWFATQYGRVPVGPGLLNFPCMYHREAPGNTCMGSLRTLSSGDQVSNTSKGNGTVMRCAPIALFGLDRGEELNSMVSKAIMDAEVTHKHAFAGESSAFLCGLYYAIAEGNGFCDAVQTTATNLTGVVSEPILDLVLSMLNYRDFKFARVKLGGWVAEQALALAVGSVAHSSNYLEVLTNSLCIDGDSDTVGGIAGGLSAAVGMLPPEELVSKVNVLPAIEYVLSL